MKSTTTTTTTKIGIDLLINHFIPLMKGDMIERYRMLILNSHGSYLTTEFDHTDTKNYIILICMSLYSSYLL
jgi:hypothetical protein